MTPCVLLHHQVFFPPRPQPATQPLLHYLAVTFIALWKSQHHRIWHQDLTNTSRLMVWEDGVLWDLFFCAHLLEVEVRLHLVVAGGSLAVRYGRIGRHWGGSFFVKGVVSSSPGLGLVLPTREEALGVIFALLQQLALSLIDESWAQQDCPDVRITFSHLIFSGTEELRFDHRFAFISSRLIGVSGLEDALGTTLGFEGKDTPFLLPRGTAKHRMP